MASAARDSANMACVLCSPTAMMMPYSGTATAAVSSRERRTTERFQRSSKRKARKTRLRMRKSFPLPATATGFCSSSTNSGSTSNPADTEEQQGGTGSQIEQVIPAVCLDDTHDVFRHGKLRDIVIGEEKLVNGISTAL